MIKAKCKNEDAACGKRVSIEKINNQFWCIPDANGKLQIHTVEIPKDGICIVWLIPFCMDDLPHYGPAW